MTGQYLIYLRKSRKDMDAERAGAGETLARHEAELRSLAARQNLTIGAVYREIVSGETIAARPEMQRLLSEVESGSWSGVLVMEIERLARGATKDQGIVAEAFKYGNARIITPAKTYDPNDEFDEEYFEFGLFMSRREYKTINRRIQRGRIASVREGRYIAAAAPYGYERIKITSGKGYTLQIVPHEAEIVQLIFHLYTAGLPDGAGEAVRLGSGRIAAHLNFLHIPARKSDAWSASSVRDILSNPTYTGKVRWQWRREVKQVINGSVVTSRPSRHEGMIYDGLHEAIIDEDTFLLAEKLRRHKARPPVKSGTVLKNPLAGLVYCEKCGCLMTRQAPAKRQPYDTLKCPNTGCDNISAPLALIEQSILRSLSDWGMNYELHWQDIPPEDNRIIMNSLKTAAAEEERRILQLKDQLDNTFTFLEQGIYSRELFIERNRKLTEQIDNAAVRLEALQNRYAADPGYNIGRTELIPAVRSLPEVYQSLENAGIKNAWLKQILVQVRYLKKERNKKNDGENANFEIWIYPRIPGQ